MIEPNLVDQAPNPISVPYLSSGTGYRIVWTPEGQGDFLTPKLCYLHYIESQNPSISSIPRSLLQFRLNLHICVVTFQGLGSCLTLSLKPWKRFHGPVDLASLCLYLIFLHLSTIWPVLPSYATSPGWVDVARKGPACSSQPPHRNCIN